MMVKIPGVLRAKECVLVSKIEKHTPSLQVRVTLMLLDEEKLTHWLARSFRDYYSPLSIAINSTVVSITQENISVSNII